MKVTLSQLRRIIKEVLETSQNGDYQFEGDVDHFEEGDQEEISKILQGKGVKPGKVQVKGGSGGEIRLKTSDGRVFNLNIQDIPDSSEGGDGSSQKKSGGKPQQNGQKL